MTTKEKAEELIEKYADALPSVFYNSDEAKNYPSAKKCALIAVDEIINSSPIWPNDVDWDDCGATHRYYYQAQREEAKKYWDEVKLEIENL
jgi:hypothetical protein